MSATRYIVIGLMAGFSTFAAQSQQTAPTDTNPAPAASTGAKKQCAKGEVPRHRHTQEKGTTAASTNDCGPPASKPAAKKQRDHGPRTVP